MEGAFVHHLRYPWSADKTRWREDEHASYEASPAVLVIPARVLVLVSFLNLLDFDPHFAIMARSYIPLPTACLLMSE